MYVNIAVLLLCYNVQKFEIKETKVRCIYAFKEMPPSDKNNAQNLNTALAALNWSQYERSEEFVCWAVALECN
jgi:hypothetical protein